MGDKATLRLARQELEDLYLGVPDESVDLTFRDFAFKPAASSSSGKALPAAATTTTTSNLPNSAAAIADHVSVDNDNADGERNKKQTTTGTALARSSTNIFTYRPLEDHEGAVAGGGGAAAGGGGLAAGAGGGGGLLQLPPIPASPLTLHLPFSDDDDDDYADHHQYHYPAEGAAAGTTTSSKSASAAGDHQATGGRRPRRSHVADDAMGGRDRRAPRSNNSYRRPGIPHSNICALCNNSVYVFRHRCLVCGRVYCRRCVGTGMGDMTEGRKCIDCLGRRYSHRYIHRAGDTGACGFCFWGNAKAVIAQELIWAEKGPAPRRRPRPKGSSYISSASYGGDGGYYSSTNTVASASMSMTMNSDSSIAMMKMNGGQGRSISGMPASASSSFVAAFPHNPHALPL